MVCSPDKMEYWNWSDSNFLLRKVVHPICHCVSVIILLIVAITYFVLPPLRYIIHRADGQRRASPVSFHLGHLHLNLYFSFHLNRDLVGNIVTTITCCLIVIQLVNLIRIFIEFSNHINILLLGMSEQSDIYLIHSHFLMHSIVQITEYSK